MQQLILTTLTFLITALTAGSAFSQMVFATTQISAANGACTTCSVTDPQNSVTTDTTDYATINLTVQTAGAQVWQQLTFPSDVPAGTFTYVIVEHLTQQSLTATNLTGVRLCSYLNNSSNLDTKHSSQYSIVAWGATKYVIGYAPTSNFNTIEISMITENPVNPLAGIRVYAAFYGTGPLPIELLYFKGAASNENIHLDWATATETNNSYFTVERSSNGMQFEAAGIVTGAGNSITAKYYAFKDTWPGEGIYYYRLKQTDHDGVFAYSKVIAVECRKRELSLEVWPNPSDGKELQLYMMDEGDLSVEIFSLSGQIMFSGRYSGDAGVRNIHIENKLEKGLYVVRVYSGDRAYMQKLVVN